LKLASSCTQVSADLLTAPLEGRKSIAASTQTCSSWTFVIWPPVTMPVTGMPPELA